MAKLGDLIVRVGADTRDLNKKLGRIQRNTRRSFGNIEKLGKNLSMAVTLPMAAMAATSVQAFRQQEKAIAQVNAGLKSTAGQVGFTSKELQKMASDLQKNTLFGDEQILKDATAQLLTFTNITGQQFDRTQQAALDLATRLDGDLKSASIQLGKALNDPVANLSQLSRSGIQFSDEQKKVIKSLAETGRLAEAQTLILDELDKQYGGSAEAAAEADGGITQLKNAFGDLQEEIGGVVMKALKPVIRFLRGVIDGFSKLDGVTKSIITAFGIVAATIGPILVLLPQLASVAAIAGPALAAAFTAMTGPIGLAIMAIAAITTAIFMFFDDVKGPITDVINFFITLFNENESVRMAVGFLKTAVVSNFKIMKRAVMSVVETFGVLFDAISTALTQGFSAGFDALTSGLGDIARKVAETGEEVGEDFAKAYADAVKKEPIELVTTDDLDDAKDKFLSLFDFFSNTGTQADVVVNPVIKTDDITLDIDEIGDDIEDFVDDLDFDPQSFLAGLERMRERLNDFKDSVASAFENAARSVAVSVGEIIGSLVAGTKAPQNFGTMLLNTFANLAVQLGQLAIGYGIAIDGIKKALKSLNPVLAVVAGVALIALGKGLQGAVAKRADNAGVPALAKGGMAFGPTMAIIGDNRNAAIDPEVVAPLSKLRDMMGGNQVEVFGRISGNDIFLSNARTGISRNRYA